MSFDTVPCKTCKKPILRPAIRDHQAGCIKAKQEKARKKKEAKEEKARAKQNADKADGGDGDGKSILADDDGSEIKVDSLKPGSAKKSASKNPNDDSNTKKAKKRKADGVGDGEEGGGEKKKKKLKKDEPKPPKVPKPKGPVDVERQCGVTLPNGGQCARSLTCKSHSMGAKRAVPGRSLPYDILLSQYQKKNQARQQKAALESNAPIYDEDDPEFGGGTGAAGGVGGMMVDSESEKEAVMAGIVRGMRSARPIVTQTRAPMRRKYQLVRMKETLSNALSGNKALFNVSDSTTSAVLAAGHAQAAAGGHGMMRGALSAAITGGVGGGGGTMDSGSGSGAKSATSNTLSAHAHAHAHARAPTPAAAAAV